MIVTGAGTPPPLGPWAGLGLAVLCFAAGFALIRLIRRAFDHDPRSRMWGATRPPWWRIRVVGYMAMTIVPLVFFAFCAGFSMITYSAYVWTGFIGAATAGAVFGLCAVGCFWSVYDSFGPRAWRPSGRDEYTL